MKLKEIIISYFLVDSGIAQDGEGPILNHTLDLTAEADNTPLVEPRLKMITHKQVSIEFSLINKVFSCLC